MPTFLNDLGPINGVLALLVVAILACALVLWDTYNINTTLIVRISAGLNNSNSDGAVFFRKDKSHELVVVYFQLLNTEKPSRLTKSQEKDLVQQVHRLHGDYSLTSAIEIEAYWSGSKHDAYCFDNPQKLTLG